MGLKFVSTNLGDALSTGPWAWTAPSSNRRNTKSRRQQRCLHFPNSVWWLGPLPRRYKTWLLDLGLKTTYSFLSEGWKCKMHKAQSDRSCSLISSLPSLLPAGPAGLHCRDGGCNGARCLLAGRACGHEAIAQVAESSFFPSQQIKKTATI